MMRDTNVANFEAVTLGEIEKSVVFVTVNGSENILGSCFGFDLEFKTSIFGSFSGEVDVINFIKSDINWGLKDTIWIVFFRSKNYLVKIHETTFQWEENTSLSTVIARNTIVS